MIAHAYLGLHLVTVGHGHIVHLVAQTYDAHVLSVGPAHTYALPYSDVFLCLFVLPVAGYNLAAYTHAGADVAKLAVAVGTLVEIHEVHVHGLPGYLGVILCMEVEQGLGENLQSVYPHLGGREGVHPCDDASTTRVVVGCLHDVLDFARGVGGAFIHHFDRKIA